MSPRRYLDRRLRLNHLRAVDAIDTHRSLLKASSALGLSQPALTKNLRELEEMLQLRLFDRLPRGMRATEAGVIFVRAARRVLAELRRLDEQLDLLSVPGGGTVAIGALPVAAAGILPGTLTRLKEMHPAVRVRLQQGRTEDLLPLLASGDIDLIVGQLYRPPIPDGFTREALWTEPISILAHPGHPLLSAKGNPREELRRYDLVLPTFTQRIGEDIENLLGALGLTSEKALRSSSYDFIREMLVGTDMISVVPRLMMVGDLMRGTLCIVPLPVAAPDRPAGLILRQAQAISAPAAAFMDCLRAYVAELAGRGIAGSITSGDSKARRSDRTPRRRAR